MTAMRVFAPLSVRQSHRKKKLQNKANSVSPHGHPQITQIAQMES
jgi:hypothetical protein